MKNKSFQCFAALVPGLVLFSASALHADPQISSWLTAYSGQYARVFLTDADLASGNAVSTWSRNSLSQALPAYCGVSELDSSPNWVYLHTSGLASHVMGPWYLDAARTNLFPNVPVNQKAIYRIPRNPGAAGTKTLTSLGVTGYFVDGVAMFDSRDAYYWNGSADVMGTGNWNRDAWVNEGITFDAGYAHQQQTGTHHYHANPIALRYQLGDNVLYDAATGRYSENTNNPSPAHSPILAWAADGYPIYGPYGYSNPTNATSPMCRIRGGFALRNGQNGTVALTNRATIPQWAARFYGVSVNQSGPAVSASYPLGRYIEDNDFLGDLTNAVTTQPYQQGVDFDLDEYNGRFCVTPEFPGGTYAYFNTVDASGAPVFPYNVGRAFYGSPAGGSVTSISETVTTNFLGGANAALQLNRAAWTNQVVTLVWSAVEGGTYLVESSSNLVTWKTNAAGLEAAGNRGSYSGASAEAESFFRVARTALANYDTTGGGTGGGGGGILSISPISTAAGSTITLTINLDPAAQPAPPPQNAPINSVMVGTITGVNNIHVSQTQVSSKITIPGGTAPGVRTVQLVFPGPPDNPSQTVTYTLPNGFMVN